MTALAEKVMLTVVMVGWFFAMPVTGYYCDGIATHSISAHFLYMVSHGNVWHLLGNLFILWLWNGELCLSVSAVIAFACSFLPAWGLWPIGMTVGFSGVLFAMAGIRWGQSQRTLQDFCLKALPFAVLGVFIPHVNWCIHFYCIVAGFAYGRCQRKGMSAAHR